MGTKVQGGSGLLGGFYFFMFFLRWDSYICLFLKRHDEVSTGRIDG